uniref:Uncharacterized protein n=2 Tax=Eptatretus burgeri TaxID=7764 RepID=A0A8C4Q3Z7_EPTBU
MGWLPLVWLLQHQLTFQKALLFVMMDLTGKVSSGVVDVAAATLEKLLLRCASPLQEEEWTPEIAATQKMAVHAATHELVREVTSPNSTVRNQAMRSLRVLARAATSSVAEIMEPHKEVLQDMIPPNKHVLEHQPANVQIGLMEGNTFCTTLRPRLFSMDLNILEHKDFFSKEMKICASIINLLHVIPAAPQSFVKPLVDIVMKIESVMLIEAGSPFRDPLIKFLTRFP